MHHITIRVCPNDMYMFPNLKAMRINEDRGMPQLIDYLQRRALWLMLYNHCNLGDGIDVGAVAGSRRGQMMIHLLHMSYVWLLLPNTNCPAHACWSTGPLFSCFTESFNPRKRNPPPHSHPFSSLPCNNGARTCTIRAFHFRSAVWGWLIYVVGEGRVWLGARS